MNARADFEQQQDEQERIERTMQALMNVAAVGLRNEADFLAVETGMWSIWKQEIQPKGASRGKD